MMLIPLLMLALNLSHPASAGGPDCSIPPGALPHPALVAGSVDPRVKLEHVIVIMQENHSFDNYLGLLNDPGYYGDEIDGIRPTMGNPDDTGHYRPVVREERPCSINPDHSWDGEHIAWNDGKNDGFFRANEYQKKGPADVALHYYDDGFLEFYYALANQFTVADRYFSPVLAPTIPNRLYFMAGTSYGHITNHQKMKIPGGNPKTIFDLLNQHHISWRYYYSDLPFLGLIPHVLLKNVRHIAFIGRFRHDLKTGNLPSVVFIDPSTLTDDEHPPHDIQLGQRSVANHVQALMESPYWTSSAMMITYDENGGFFDHVPPPKACAPDDIPPALKPGDVPGDFAQYGFRVPFVLVSPYARRHYVAHSVYDHTSILRFIETWFNLPALTRRDANANPMLDIFDFDHPDFSIPTLPKATVGLKQVLGCLLKHNSRGFPDDGGRGH